MNNHKLNSPTYASQLELGLNLIIYVTESFQLSGGGM